MFLYDEDKQYHCENGPAIVNNGSSYWYNHGKLHRLDGPAVIGRDGRKQWYVNGKLHRLDGPAVDNYNWDYFVLFMFEWWIDGVQINCKDNEEFLRIVKMKELL
jgi:hypothetical protein